MDAAGGYADTDIQAGMNPDKKKRKRVRIKKCKRKAANFQAVKIVKPLNPAKPNPMPKSPSLGNMAIKSKGSANKQIHKPATSEQQLKIKAAKAPKQRPIGGVNRRISLKAAKDKSMASQAKHPIMSKMLNISSKPSVKQRSLKIRQSRKKAFANFDEDFEGKHPRANDGKFGSGSGNKSATQAANIGGKYSKETESVKNEGWDSKIFTDILSGHQDNVSDWEESGFTPSEAYKLMDAEVGLYDDEGQSILSPDFAAEMKETGFSINSIVEAVEAAKTQINDDTDYQGIMDKAQDILEQSEPESDVNIDDDVEADDFSEIYVNKLTRDYRKIFKTVVEEKFQSGGDEESESLVNELNNFEKKGIPAVFAKYSYATKRSPESAEKLLDMLSDEYGNYFIDVNAENIVEGFFRFIGNLSMESKKGFKFSECRIRIKRSYPDIHAAMFGQVYDSKDGVPKDKTAVRISRGKNSGKYYGRAKKAAKTIAGALKKVSKPKAMKYKTEQEFIKSHGEILHHGTSAAEFDKFSGLTYLTSDPKEAQGFSKGVHLGGGKGGKERVIDVAVKLKKTKAIDELIMDDLMEGDIDEGIEREVAAAKKEGYDSVSFSHPSTYSDGDFQAVIPFDNNNIKTTKELKATWQKSQEKDKSKKEKESKAESTEGTIKEHHMKTSEELQQEKHPLTYYSTYGHIFINKVLKGEEGVSTKDKKEAKEFIPIIDEMMKDEGIKSKRTVFRGVSSNVSNSDEFKVGETISWKGYISTSTDIKVAKRIGKMLFEIETSEGVDMKNYTFYRTQKEILLPRDRNYKVKEIKGNKVKLELLPETSKSKKSQKKDKSKPVKMSERIVRIKRSNPGVALFGQSG